MNRRTEGVYNASYKRTVGPGVAAKSLRAHSEQDEVNLEEVGKAINVSHWQGDWG